MENNDGSVMSSLHGVRVKRIDLPLYFIIEMYSILGLDVGIVVVGLCCNLCVVGFLTWLNWELKTLN